MSSSSSTTAIEPQARPAAAPARPPGLSRLVCTIALMCIWALLMAIGVLSAWNPPFLEKLSSYGLSNESDVSTAMGDAAARRGDFALAIPQYLHSLKLVPDQPPVQINLANAYTQFGQPQLAEELLATIAPETLPPRLRAIYYFNLALACERQQRIPEAIAHCRHAIDTSIEPEKSWRKLASLYLANGQYAEARAALEETVRIQTDVLLPYRKMLARAADSLDREPAQQAEVEQRLLRDPTPEELAPYDLDLIRSMQLRDPELSRTFAMLGATCAQLRDVSAARQHLERALEIWPGNSTARENLKRLPGGA